MSAISLKSITGITSITTPAGVDNQLTLHNNNTTEAVKLDVAGNLHFHNHLNITGVSTASNFKTGTSNLHNTGLNVQDLDVDGHTNLDNVSIAGVTTTSGNITIENAEPSIFFTDTNGNPDYKIFNDSGALKIYDTTYSATRLQIGPTNGEVTIASNTNFPNGITMNPGTASVVNTIAQRLGNTTAKIRFPANDTFTVETAGDERFRITSGGAVLIDNSTGTLTIGGDNVYDSAKINLMVGSMSQTSATTEATALVIHDQNSRRNGTEGSGSWKSKITFRSTQINGNSQSEGASIVHDITYNNYSSNKMRSDLVFKTRGDAQTSASDAATEKLRIRHDGKIGIGTELPQKKLHIHASSGGTPVLITGDIPAVVLNPSAANSSDNDRSHFGQATASNNFCNGVSSGDTVLRGTNSGKLIFGLGTSIKMLITNDGNLGLGDNAPPNFTGYRSLSIHGSTGGALVFGDDGTDEWETYGGDGVFKIYDRAATTTRLHLDGAYGRFGINTSSFSDTATALSLRNGRSDNDHTILDIICNDNNTCRITFSEDSNSSKGSIRYYYTGDANYMSFYTNGGASGNERLRITSDGRLFVNTTAVVNTNDFLTIKRPAGNHDVTSMTLDATTTTGSYANAFLFTKAKDYYYNGIIFTSSTGHQGGIAGKMSVAGGTTPQIDFRVGGSGFNSSDTLALTIDDAARIRTRGATNIGHGGMVYIQGYSDPTADETKSNLTVRGEGGNGFACGTYEATANYASWIQAGYVPNFTGGSPAAIYPLVLQPNGAPVCIGNKNDASTTDAALLRVQTQTGSSYTYQKWGLSLEHFNSSNVREQKFTFINESSQGTQAKANSIFRQHAVPYNTDTTYQTFTDRIVYSHRPGYERYSWYKFNVHVTSSSRGGSARIGITWSSRHAGPGGYGEYSFAWTDEHHTSRAQVFCRKQHFLSYGGASHGPYNWTSNPAVTVYSSSGGGSSGGFYLRVEGHLDANSSTYDGGILHHFDIVHNDNNTGGNNTYFEFIQNGSSGPSQANAVLSFN